ncbi:MAG TPA: hypothetical protein VFT31_12380 [Kribbella sp.]|nr:hypothetical protein [Kribbella sp.]
MVAELVEDLVVLLADGTHALRSHGNLHGSRRRFERAYQLAAQTGDSRSMSMAALGSSGLWVHENRSVASAAVLHARLRQALSQVDPGSSIGVQLRARLAGEEDYRTGEYTRVLAVLAEARQVPEPIVLADALSIAHHCLLGPDHGALRRELATDLMAQSTRTGRRSDLLMGMIWQTVDLFLDADPHAERRLRELQLLLEQDGHLAVGFVADALEVMLAIRAGELGRAEKLAQACAERGMAAGDADATAWHAAQLVAIRWYQGRITDLLPMLTNLVHSPTLSAVDSSMFSALAVAAAVNGDRRTAAGALARLTGRDLSDLPRSSTWLVTMYGVVEAAHLLGDATTSSHAYELLSPFADLPMMASLGVACFGSARHALGVAALTMGDPQTAADHFHVAVQQNLALGHWPAVVASRLRRVEALGLGAQSSDPGMARRELADAMAEATAMGIPVRGGDREALEVSVTCTRQGRGWKVQCGDRTAIVQHSVGMLHLAVLVANPGQEISSADLVAGLSVLKEAGAGLPASPQPVLDRAAVRDYRSRLSQLRAQIDDWESKNETEPLAAARAECDWLMRELAAAAGIGGDIRRFPDGHERARVAVGKAIRRAMTRVAEADAAIGEHLRRSVHTGVRCSYSPG